MGKKTGLGQGVGLLFGEEVEKYFECNINNIVPNKYQPRTNFDPNDLKELADSISEKGVIQPLIVTTGSDGDYELIAGERRLRASKLAGLSHVPVVLLEVDNEDTLLELALIENVQRTDLNAIEEAEAYKKLIEKFGYTQEETAKRVGKQRSTVANMLRLLKLPDTIREDIVNGLLTEGHGRALVKLVDDPLKLQEVRNLIIKNSLSVRQTEKIVKKASFTKSPTKRTNKPDLEEIPSSYTKSRVVELTNRLNSKIYITQNGSRGKIEIEYYSHDDFDRVTELLLGELEN
jgi:ParB family chromosome partitioning protein